MLKYRLTLLKGLEELNYNKSQFCLQKYFLNNSVILKYTKKDYLSLGEYPLWGILIIQFLLN